MVSPEIKQVASIQPPDPDDDRSDHDSGRNQTTIVRRRRSAFAVGMEEVVEIAVSSTDAKPRHENGR